MAVIRIKRSTLSAAPSTLKTAEIAYTMGTGTQADAGDRLFFGKGDDGSGNATSIVVIGGEYFTNMLDHVHGVLTASSALIVDADSKLDNLKVDNVDINGNTISTLNADGNLILSPNGSGTVDVGTSRITSVVDPTSDQDAATKKYVDDQFSGGSVIFTIADDAAITDTVAGQETLTFNGDDWLTTAVTDNTITITHDTSGVTAGTYGSQTAIPVFTVDDRGHIDSAGTVPLATTLSTGGDNASTGEVALLSDSLSFIGGTNIHTEASGSTIIIHLDSDVQSLSGLDVTGDVDITGTFDIDNINIDGNTISSTDTNGNINLTPNGTGEVVAASLTVSDLTINRVVLAGTDGALTDNGKLTFATDTLTVDGNVQVNTNLTVSGEMDVDNIKISGNTISSTDGSNTIYIDPAPTDSDGGDLIIRGNLTVQGVTTTVNSTTVSIDDKNIVLADNATTAGEADGGGITINGPTTPATITYNGSTDRWNMNKDLDLTDSSSLMLGGIDWREVMEDHLANSTFQYAADNALTITYDDGANTLTWAMAKATATQVGVATFDETSFTVTDGDVNLATVDGGTF